MRVGFVALYSWRPHVEHLAYLGNLVSEAGHEAVYLTCDGDLPTCYTREFRPGRSQMLECGMCRASGIRSYVAQGVSSIGSMRLKRLPTEKAPFGEGWGASSAGTIGRFESNEDYESSEFAALRNRLNATAAECFEAARAWIRRERIGAIVLFNGRLDGLRGILEAAAASGVRVVSMERSWFGDGLQLLPDENCQGLKSIHRMVRRYATAPLTRTEALTAARLMAPRFLRGKTKDGRANRVRPWPVGDARHKILLVPGSRNEVWGHPDHEDGWKNRTEAFDSIIFRFGLRASDLVLRAHRSWAEDRGAQSGERSERYYREWADARGILTVGSRDRTSTLGLIDQADLVVVFGGSAAFEAGVLGKRIVNLTPSIYQEAGIAENVYSPAQIPALAPLGQVSAFDPTPDIVARTLRFIYVCAHRLPRYTSFVRCLSPTAFRYLQGADPKPLMDLIETGNLVADDIEIAGDTRDESGVVEMLMQRRWGEIEDPEPDQTERESLILQRRSLYRFVDRVPWRMDRCDRGDA